MLEQTWFLPAESNSGYVRRHVPSDELIFKTCLFLFLGGQVAKLFQDSSLGNIVNILVTRLILLTEDQVRWQWSF